VSSSPQLVLTSSDRASTCALMSPPPSRSTLFPYTTLFRSRRVPRRDASDHTHGLPHDDRGIDGLARLALYPREGFAQCGDTPQLDRKSTRLNSSHVKISYADFCLKKKNHTRAWIWRLARRA